jgi:aspartyl-tRNA(Asn)/glutamyl-tRNA(Gln) amidotransferase subunit C
MELSKDTIKHIAQLAKLELSETELDKYGSQLSGVLGYIDQLSEVDVDGVEPTAQVTGLVNVFREDRAEDWPRQEIDACLALAPDIDGRQYKVRRVLE